MPRIVLCECDDSEKWKGLLLPWFQKLLGRDGDEWKVHCLPRDDFPTPEEVAQADLVILGGGRYSANGEEGWMQRLLQVLPQWVHTGTKHIGCCLGHQALAKALGGHIGANPSGRFVLKVEGIKFDERALADCGLPSDLAQKEAQLKFVESHGECVTELPQQAELLASSDSCKVELWRLGTNVLAFQYHPEMPPLSALEKIHPAVSQVGKLNAQEQEESAKSLKEDKPDVEWMMCLLSAYRDQGLKACAQGSGPQNPGKGAVPAEAGVQVYASS